MDPLRAISPIDGRYRSYAEPLSEIFSEEGLIRHRLFVEGEYFIALSEHSQLGLRNFSGKEKKLIRNLAELKSDAIQMVSDIEKKGYKNIKATNHDVKAVEYFMKEKLRGTSLEDSLEWIHFGLTSEDVNNVAYGLMLSAVVKHHILPALKELLAKLNNLAHEYKNLPMLARTHGQPASPTTFGKECRVFAARIDRQVKQLQAHRVLVKLNGATGNYNAHHVAYPKVNWVAFTKTFADQLARKAKVNLEVNLVTTQIESHDSTVELFDILRRANTILIGFNQDMWRYISDGWIVQKAVRGEVGSSTMPHKVNPIRFENSEGNLGIANALFTYFAAKLPISRLQRDLSDSTVERNFGVALGHSLIGYRYTLDGLQKISVDKAKVVGELERHPEVITEAIQSILRREGVPMPYEKLKELTRGKTVTMQDIHAFIRSLDVSEKVKKELKSITPKNYIGIAEKLSGS